MNIIISGCLGHIGSKLTRHLTEKHYNVIGIDNLSTQRYGSLRGLIGSNNFKFFNKDLSKISQSELSNLMNYKEIGAWIHLAATTNASASFDFKNELFKNNLKSTKLAVDFCKSNGLHFIFPSSTSVYGSAESEVDESSDKFLNPQSPYAECKIKEEELIKQELEDRYQILRLGTIFGISPGIRFHTAVNKFCFQACLGMPLTVWETALHQYRPYLEIQDCCNSFEFFLKNKGKKGVYNVNTNNFTVDNIISEIKKNIPDCKIEFVSNKIMNQLSYFVSNQKILNEGFRFQGILSKSIRETINWLRFE